MKGRRKKGIAAVIMAALMLVGLVPSDFTLVQAKAADTITVKESVAAVQSDEGLKAGQKYGNESKVVIEVLADMVQKNPSGDEVDGTTYTKAVQGGTNVSCNGGEIPTNGAAFKITAVEDSKISFVIKKASGKAWYFVKKNGESAVVVNQGTGIEASCTMTFTMEKNGEYYFYLKGSKPYVYDISYSYEKESDYKKVSVDAVQSDDGLKMGTVYGDSAIANLEVLADMVQKNPSGDEVDGTTYTKAVQGGTNVSCNGGEIPTNGAAFKITAVEDSKISFVIKKASGKAWYFVKKNGESAVVVDQGTGIEASCTMKFTMEKNGEYYFYLKGSKPYVYAITLEKGTPPLNWATVSDPELGTPTIDGDTITVPYTATIGATGGESLEVTMKSGDTVVGTQKTRVEGESGSVKFKPSATGSYSFSAVLKRDGQTDKTSNTVNAEFVLPLAKPVITAAASAGNGAVSLEWNQVPEAESYEVYCDGALSGTTSDLEYKVTGLTVGKEYAFTIVAVRGTAKSVASDAQNVTATADAEIAWSFSRFGQGINTKDNGYIENADGSVTVYSEGGKGKIVPASTDGLAFYYTKIPTTSNFTLTAKVKADAWSLSNGQEGWGLMAADRVGKDGDTLNFWNNTYQAIASKVEYYVDEATGQVSDAGKKISMKLGLGVIAKTGVTQENLPKLNANDTATVQSEFKTDTQTLETSCAEMQAGTYNVFGNGKLLDSDGNVVGDMTVPDGVTALTEYYLTIQKNNTGYFVTYSDAQKNPVRTLKYYDTEALSQVDKDNVYVGFFASRRARATFSDISLTLTDPANDLPAEERPLTYVTPSYTVTSPTATGIQSYDLTFISTADGRLTIDGIAGVEDVWVKANETFVKNTTLRSGDNYFGITFTPDPNFVPLKGDKLTSYEPYYFEHVVRYSTIGSIGESIWVSPTGTSQGSGNKDNPVDIYTAVKYVQPGQQIILKGGHYDLWSTVKVARGNNGTPNTYIYMIADPDATERPVLDFNYSGPGMVLAGDYWYFKGFDVTKSGNAQKGIQVSGNNNVLDQVNAYHNGNTGIQISRLLGTDLWDNWPANNLILNCTSYGNADKGYEDADGFAAKLTIADGNVFDGCIAYNNADDGWDLFAKVETGSIGSVTIKNSVAYGNGYLEDGTNAGNGNGFKMGGDSLSGYHKLINSIAYNNKAKGIDSNSCPDIQVESSTSFNNESFNVAFYTNTAANTDYSANGILSYRKGTSVEEQIKTKGTQNSDKIYGNTNYYWDKATNQSANKAGEAVDDTWFVSLDTSVAPTRNADGTINMHGLLTLTDKAPEGVGARIEGTKSTEIIVKPSVEPDADEEKDDEEETAITNPDVTSGLNIIGQNIGVQADKGTVIKNAAGQVVTAGDIYIKALPVKATESQAEAILEVIKTKELKVADNAGIDYFEVSLVDIAGNPLTFDGKIVITFAYPNGTNAASHSFSVLHLLKSGELDIMEPTLTDSGVSVAVSELSPFAVVYSEKAADGNAGQTLVSAETGDRTPIIPIVILLIVSAGIIVAGIIISKKKRA